MVKELSDKDARYEQLIENIQRKDLDPLGRARAVDSLMKSEDWKTQRKAAEKIGLTEQKIGQWLALLKLPIDIQEKTKKSLVSMIKIRKITQVDSDEDKRVIFEKAVEEELPQKRVFEIVDAFKEIDADLTFTVKDKQEAKRRIIEAEEFVESPKSIIADIKWQKEYPQDKNLPTVGEFALKLVTKMGDVVRDLEDLAKSWGYLGEGGREAILSHLEELNEIRKQLKKEVLCAWGFWQLGQLCLDQSKQIQGK